MLLNKYDPGWPGWFERIKDVLTSKLKYSRFQIEHVGSTAVPNLDSKPIIDIDILYESAFDFESIKSNLLQLGYIHHGNQGIQDREVFKRGLAMYQEVLDTIPHHLYAGPMTSKALERHILMRDFLRKNEWARVFYQTKKYELAQLANQERKLYQELKERQLNRFIDDIVQQEKDSLE